METTPTTTTVFSQRILDDDFIEKPNFTPIYGLKDAPIMTLEEAFNYAKENDEDPEELFNLMGSVFCAQLFAERFIDDPFLSRDEIAVIQLYTQESPFYSILNKRLRDENRQKLKPLFPLLKLLMGALYKLPPISNMTVFRGVKKNLSQDFQKGKKKIWWGFSSTTISIGVLQSEQFLGKQGERTMFTINTISARDISPYSANKGEQEILILPGTCMVVRDILDLGNDLILVQLKELLVPGLIDLAATTSSNSDTLQLEPSQSIRDQPIIPDNSQPINNEIQLTIDNNPDPIINHEKQTVINEPHPKKNKKQPKGGSNHKNSDIHKQQPPVIDESHTLINESKTHSIKKKNPKPVVVDNSHPVINEKQPEPLSLEKSISKTTLEKQPQIPKTNVKWGTEFTCVECNTHHIFIGFYYYGFGRGKHSYIFKKGKKCQICKCPIQWQN